MREGPVPSPGRVNNPIVFAGAAVDPGDAIVADDDGVVVVPADLVQKRAEAVQRAKANQESKRAKLASCVLGPDLYQRDRWPRQD